VGVHGIVPAADQIARIRESAGDAAFWDAPTLAWWSASDDALLAIALLGVVGSAMLAAGVLPLGALALCLVGYVSLVNVGGPFTHFQWDMLLIEAGFLSLPLMPFVVVHRRRSAREPLTLAVWPVRLLLAKLMFLSGWVKLDSGDPSWSELVALSYHYETQPLPNPLAYSMHHLPLWCHQLGALFMFAVELAMPVLALLPQRLARRSAGAAIGGLMLMILATGNYGFFNLLTLALTIPLFDDAPFEWWFGRQARLVPNDSVEHPRVRTFLRRSVAALAVLLMLGSSIPALRALRVGDRAFWNEALSSVDGLHLWNSYGLFAVMTTHRPELILEGTRDGITWEAYELPYKPGSLDRAPPFLLGHMPRLDWQMWFAALGSYRRNPWLVRLMEQLRDGQPRVLRLFEHNPFGAAPPRAVRALIYEYHFTRPADKASSGDWWRRGESRLYAPLVQ
jgi:hypothetical protein